MCTSEMPRCFVCGSLKIVMSCSFLLGETNLTKIDSENWVEIWLFACENDGKRDFD